MPFKKIFTIIAIVLLVISQLQILPALAEMRPQETSDLSLSYLKQQKEKTMDDLKLNIGEPLTLYVESKNTRDSTVEIPLGKNIEYNNKVTAQLNKDRKDLTVAYRKKTNTVYVNWTEKTKERNVKLQVQATKEGSNQLFVESKRDKLTFKSKEINVQTIDNRAKESRGAAKSDTLGSENEISKHPSISKKVDASADSKDKISKNAISKQAVTNNSLTATEFTQLTQRNGVIAIPSLGSVSADSKYSFWPNITEDTTARVISSNNTNATVSSPKSIPIEVQNGETQKASISIQFSNMGLYNGKSIDVIVTITNITNAKTITLTDMGLLDVVGTGDFYKITTSADVSTKFLYTDTQAPATITGHTTFNNINEAKTVTSDLNQFADIYAMENTKVGYVDNPDGSTTLGALTGGSKNTPDTQVTLTFDNLSELTYSYSSSTTGSGSKLNTGFFSEYSLINFRFDNPPVMKGTTLASYQDAITNNNELYSIRQVVPFENDNGYVTDFTMSNDINTDFDVKASDIRVTDVYGTDVTANFDIAINNGTLTAKAKNISSADFYDNTYTIHVVGKLKKMQITVIISIITGILLFQNKLTPMLGTVLL
ncbi:adhesive domain-containing protein [Listeria sp. PSOL-1]|uniref:adhesive domain-containing protein n=1 Tax=Listeria sp. PSOL-1 TaxID=1844999 RepID=UPI0013D36F01|nr:adhesive domain-containing protein [Listeria sp. PSOL-1]